MTQDTEYAAEHVEFPGHVAASPSAWGRRLVVIVLASIDLLLAVYLAAYQSRFVQSVWDPLFGMGSQQVLDSAVSETFRSIFLVPDAALGALAYLAEVVLGLVGSTERYRERPWFVIAFGVNAATTTGVGIVLVLLQATVVGAWCFFCLITALLSLLMFCLAWRELKAALEHLRRKYLV